MALPTAVAGSRRPSALLTWLQDDTTTPEDLTGATLTGVIQRADSVDVITGALTVTDGDAGVFRWDFSEADVAEAGLFWVQFTAAFASGQSPAKTFTQQWIVKRSIA